MKVLFIHNRYLNHGGEDSVVDAEIQMLRANDVEVDTYIVSNPKNKIFQVFYLMFSFFNLISFWNVYKKIKLSDPDVVHVHNWHYAISPSVFWAAKLASKEIFFTIHNYRLLCPSGTLVVRGKLYLDSVDRKFAWPAVLQGIYHDSSLATFFVAFCIYFNSLIRTWDIPDRIVFVNSFMEDFFLNSKLRLKKGKTVVKPHFIDSTGVDPDIVSRRSGFVFVGRLSEEKGVESLLKAFSGFNLNITIVGGGPLEDLVRDYADRFPNITFRGFLGRSEILQLLAKSEAMVFPSLCYEGMPVSVLEAYSCATPVLSSRIGSMQSLVLEGKTGLFFSPGDQASLEATIKKWTELDEGMKLAMRESTFLEYREKYTRERNFDHFRTLYKF